MYLRAAPCCDRCARHAGGLGEAPQYPAEQRQAFDDFMSLLSFLSIILNLAR